MFYKKVKNKIKGTEQNQTEKTKPNRKKIELNRTEVSVWFWFWQKSKPTPSACQSLDCRNSKTYQDMTDSILDQIPCLAEQAWLF